MSFTEAVLFIFALYIANGYGVHLRNPSVTQVTSPIDHAEGPHWDVNKQVLFYVDIMTGTVLAYHYDTQQVYKIKLGGNVTPVVPAGNIQNLLYVGLDRNVVAVEWDGKGLAGRQRVVVTGVNSEWTHSRFNDGKADKSGRLWWGTMDLDAAENHKSHLYRITNNKVETVLSGISNSNGLAWNRANNKFYYIDTPTGKVVEFDYVAATGTISAKNRTVFDVNLHSDLTGVPDGMTIDIDDNLYVALWGGGVVVKVNSKTGEVLQKIPLPAKHITSAMFGGPDLDILFITTSRVSLTPEERLVYPDAGSVFAVQNLGTRGLPANSAHILDSF